MPYNSGTGAYERRSATVIDATPDGDTVAVAIDVKLDQGIDDYVVDLNHHKTNGNHYPAPTTADDSRYLDQSPAGVVSWKDGVPVADAALKDFSNVASGAISPAKIAQDASNRFVTDAEKATWNGALYDKSDVEGVLTGDAISTHGHSFGFTATKVADQTGILPSTLTKIIFDAEEWDSSGLYDPSTSRFTPPAGKYLICAQLSYSAGVVDQEQYRVMIYKNGAFENQNVVNASGSTSVMPTICTTVSANGTDYFEIYTIAGGTGNKTIPSSPNTFFQAHKI